MEEDKKPEENPSENHEEQMQSEPNTQEDVVAPAAHQVVSREIEDEMKESYLSYSMSVIVGRALPGVKDGLKPVHRRILFAMQQSGLSSTKPFRKSATVVGEVLGKYHPHGDMAVYDSMVRMAQDFSLRYPLVQGHGNFGSIDGDSPAAYRYTEARLNKLSEELLQDIEKNTVDHVPNFDESIKEPVVLPSKFPNLLVNGSSGIAVGMATSMPPHNLNEVCAAMIKQIENPDIEVKELLESIQGPDFPTGGIIEGRAGIMHAYATGRGKVSIKSRATIDEFKKDRQRIIVNEIPYQVNKSTLIEDIAKLIKNKKVEGISDLRDESDREGIRIVIELKTGISGEIVLNQLYKHSNLRTTFSIINLALVDNQPKTLNIKQLNYHFIKHRQDVVRRRTQFDLDKAEARAHILEGLIIALNNLEETIELIKQSKNAEEARNGLIDKFKLTEKQAQAILEMRLQRLTGLEQNKIKEEHKELLKVIEDLKSILADEQKILAIIKDELTQLVETYGDERRTTILEQEGEEIVIEDMIEPKDMVVTISHKGYTKRLTVDTYKTQKRGGRGVKAAETKDDDYIEDVFIANTHDYLLFFTDKGQVHWMKVYKIPESSRQARGSAIVNLLELKDEKIQAFIPVKEFKENFNLCLVTKKGTIKKTALSEFANPRKGGVRAITLDEGDELITAKMTNGDKNIIIATKKGMSIKFDEKQARPIGRSGKGVRGINLKEGDEVIGMIIEEPGATILTITENGYGKRTNLEEYRVIGRGGVGVINIQCTEKNGKVVQVACVTNSDEYMVISKNGIMIRIPVSGISVIGRNTQGVRIMKVGEDDRVVSATKIALEDEEDHPPEQ